MRTATFAFAATMLAGLAAASPAKAGIYLDMINGAANSGQLTGSSSIDVNGLTVGNYSIGSGVVSTTPNNPLAVDFGSFATTATGTPGLLQIAVSATGLTAPLPSFISMLTQASGHVLDGALLGMTVTTYIDTTNAIDGMQTKVSSFSIGQVLGGQGYYQNASALYDLLSGPFSETFVIDLTLASNTDVSADTSLTPTVVPEPASFALLGSAMLGMVFLRRRHAAQGF